MARDLTRRQLLQQLGATAGAAMLPLGVIRGQDAPIIVAGVPVEVAVFSVSPDTARITVRPVESGATVPLAETGALVSAEFGAARERSRTLNRLRRVNAGNLVVGVTDGPPTISILRAGVGGQTPGPTDLVQQLQLSATEPGMSFLLPNGPLLGLGEGGAQFDRKGATDRMRNGQVNSDADGYRLAIHGTRMPIQWLVGTDGWAMFIHQPYGAFDFTGTEGRDRKSVV